MGTTIAPACQNFNTGAHAIRAHQDILGGWRVGLTNSNPDLNFEEEQGIQSYLQFAIRTSKASRPRRTPGTAVPVRKAARVQAVTCLAQLALPHELGRSQGEAATALNLHSHGKRRGRALRRVSTCCVR